MDTLCQGGKVEIERTDDNAGMRGCGVMQPDEMASIECHHDPALRHSKCQDIRNLPTSVLDFSSRFR
jgi:hypothetical protein